MILSPLGVGISTPDEVCISLSLRPSLLRSDAQFCCVSSAKGAVPHTPDLISNAGPIVTICQIPSAKHGAKSPV